MSLEGSRIGASGCFLVMQHAFLVSFQVYPIVVCCFRSTLRSTPGGAWTEPHKVRESKEALEIN